MELAATGHKARGGRTMRQMSIVFATPLCAPLLACACGGSDVPVGESGAAALIGDWQGYIENFQFRSGSDAIVVGVQSGQGSQIGGYVVFGAGQPPPKPTDPNIGPPGVTKAEFLNPEKLDLPWEGFAYTILQSNLTDTRLRFSIKNDEVFKEWCELLTPYHDASGSYSCLPDCGAGGDGMTTCYLNFKLMADGSYVCGTGVDAVPVDCTKLRFCTSPVEVGGCDCTADGCTMPANSQDVLHFDLAVDSEHANGSVVGNPFDTRNVRLTRAQ
jgi:hypothetical protein